MDEFFFPFIYFIFIVIFVIVKMRKNKAAAAKRPPVQPKPIVVPAAIEEDDIVDTAWQQFRGQEAAPAQFIPEPQLVNQEPEIIPLQENITPIDVPVIYKETKPSVSTKSRKGFHEKLAGLSRLKQAVIMAEVLGKPRGLRDTNE